MSFEWNSDEGEEDFSSWGMNDASKGANDPSSFATGDTGAVNDEKEDRKLPAAMNDFDNSNIFASSAQGINDFDEDEDEDSVDWEDADDDQSNNAVPNHALTAVTIDLGGSKKKEDSSKTKKERKRRRRNVWKSSQLPHDLQNSLKELRRASLLAWITHVHFMISDSILQTTEVARVVSLVPRTFWNGLVSPPSIQVIRDFSIWYTSWLTEQIRPQPSRRGRARASANSPRRSSASSDLSQQQSYYKTSRTMDRAFADWIIELLSDSRDHRAAARKSPYRALFSNLLGYALLSQALGVRARWCMALKEVTSLDLSVHHPWLLSATRHVFLAASGIGRNGKRKKAKQTRAAPQINDGPLPFIWGWIEVQCLPQGEKSKVRWMHLDLSSHQGTSRFLVDQPQTVESTLADLEHASASVAHESNLPSLQPPPAYQKRRKRKRGVSGPSPVAYVLAVETQNHTTPTRFVDVTPRYAESRVRTLQQRGLSRVEIQNELSSASSKKSTWWSQTLARLSQRDEAPYSGDCQTSPNHQGNRGSSAENAILVDLNNSEEDAKPAARIVTDEKKKIARSDGDHNGKKLFACGDEKGKHKNLVEPSPTSQGAEEEEAEDEEISFSNDATKEPMPKSKSGFAKHPVYVLKSQLGKTQVLRPKAIVCGLFAGEAVYLRRDVSQALEAKAWLYQGRRVKDTLLSKPLIKLKPRKKVAKKGFVALKSYGVGLGNDGSEQARAAEKAAASTPLDQLNENKERLLYGEWQTDKWSPPPVGPHDPIPLNEHKNVELALLNPGLVHIDIPIAAVQVAKQLGVPYAPCLVGFNSAQGTPVIRGIVVHEVNAEMIQQGAQEINHHKSEKQGQERKRVVMKSWKKLMVGILVKQRIDREYGSQHEETDDVSMIDVEGSGDEGHY